MTDAQKLTEEFRQITAPGSFKITWIWAQRATANLEPLGNSIIGDRKKVRLCHSIALFRCADGSRFGYDLNGARQVWAMPDDREFA
jgi:hypothetical protein